MKNVIEEGTGKVIALTIVKHCVFHQREETCGDPVVHEGAVPGGGRGDGYVERVRMGARVYTDIRVCITRIVSALRGMDKVNTVLGS